MACFLAEIVEVLSAEMDNADVRKLIRKLVFKMILEIFPWVVLAWVLTILGSMLVMMLWIRCIAQSPNSVANNFVALV